MRPRPTARRCPATPTSACAARGLGPRRARRRRRRLGASRGFGGREVVQTWVRAGDRLVASGCRRRGARRQRPGRVPPGRRRPAQAVARRAEARARRRDAGEAPRARGGRARRHSRPGPRLGRRDRRRPGAAARAAALRPSLPDADRRPRRVLSLGPRGRPALRRAGRRRRLPPSLGSHHLPHLRRHPDRAQGAGDRQPGPRAQGRVRTLVPGPRDLGGGDRAQRRRGRRAPRLLRHGAAPRPRVALGGGGDGVRPTARRASAATRGSPSCWRASDRDHAAGQSRRLHLVAQRLQRGDALGENPDLTLVEAVGPPGGLFAYRRKNCNGEIFGPQFPCELSWGVDPNRNYANNWGGSGSSADAADPDLPRTGSALGVRGPRGMGLRSHPSRHDADLDPQRRGPRPAPAGDRRDGLCARRAEAQGDRRRDGHRRGVRVAVRLPALRHGRYDRGRHLRGHRRVRLHDRDGPAERQLPHGVRDRDDQGLDRRERVRRRPWRAARGAARRRRGRGRRGHPLDPPRDRAGRQRPAPAQAVRHQDQRVLREGPRARRCRRRSRRCA